MKNIIIFVLGFVLSFATLSQVAFGNQMGQSRDIYVETNRIPATNILIHGSNLLEVLKNLQLHVGTFVSNIVGTNVYYLDSNPSNFISDVLASNWFLSVTNNFYHNSNPSNYITAADIPSFLTSADDALICGLVPEYLSASSVRVTPGILTMQKTNFYELASPFTVDLTTLLGATVTTKDFIYIYADKSSFAATNPSFYGAVSEPTNSVGGGWYNSSIPADRLVGSLRSDETGSDVLEFSTVINSCLNYEYIIIESTPGTNNFWPEASQSEFVMWVHSSLTNQIWKPPNVAGSTLNDMVPVAATRVLLSGACQNSGGSSASTHGSIAFGSVYTDAVAHQHATTNGGSYMWFGFDSPMDHVIAQGWLPIQEDKSTRNVFIAWHAPSGGATPNAFRGSINAWEVIR